MFEMNIAVIFAGGSGKRMKNAGMPKQFLKINDVPIIIHTLRVFEQCQEIDAIVVACIKTHIEQLEELVKKYGISKVKKITPGGKTGQLSIYNGLIEAKKISNKDDDIVLIHDGVRPIIDVELLENNIEMVRKQGNAISCIKQKETTIISKDGQTADYITNRENTYIARAPQSFYLNKILKLHNRAIAEQEENIIDSASMMLRYGEKINIVECNSDNIKITTPDDYYIAKALLQAKESKDVLGV